MRDVTGLAFGALLLVVLLSAAVLPAAGAQLPSNSENQNETSERTIQDVKQNMSVGDIEEVVHDPRTVEARLGNNSYVSSVDWRPKQDVAYLVVHTDAAQTATFTDASGIEREGGSANFRYISKTIPASTEPDRAYLIKVPATAEDNGYQEISIFGFPRGTIIYTEDKTTNVLPDRGNRLEAFGAGIIMSIVVATINSRQLRRDDANKQNRIA